MQVSVVIPVFNAGPHVAQAVESALAQEETAEVLLVEDGSGDDSLAVCRRLAEQHADRVRLLHHPGNANRGAGASRNLGIDHASSPFIAFLDADDWYLPGRFREAARVFAEDPEVDGVYEPVRLELMPGTSREHWESVYPGLVVFPDERVRSEELLRRLVKREKGRFCTDGIVFKRSLLDKSGMFDERMPLAQDTHLYIRFAAVGNLAPGSLQPIAVYRIHPRPQTARRSELTRARCQVLIWKSLVGWLPRHGAPADVCAHARRRLLDSLRSVQCLSTGWLLPVVSSMVGLAGLAGSDPHWLLRPRWWLSLGRVPVPCGVLQATKRLAQRTVKPTHICA